MLSKRREIEKLKRHETGCNAAVERLNQPFEKMSGDDLANMKILPEDHRAKIDRLYQN